MHSIACYSRFVSSYTTYRHKVVDGTNRSVSDVAHEHLPLELVAELIPVAKANNVITRTRPSVRHRSKRSGPISDP